MKLNIGENIRKNRTRLGWTQTQLAERLGTSVQSVSRWESGGGYPDMELLPELARAFDVSVDELFGSGNREKPDVNEMLQTAYKIFYTPDPSPKKAAEYLRTVRLEYPEKAVDLCFPLGNVSPEKLNQSEEFMKELRLTVEKCLGCSETPSSIGSLLNLLLCFETQENFRSVVRKYSLSHSHDRSVQGMYMIRARASGDRKLFGRLRNERTVLFLADYLRMNTLSLCGYRPDGAYDYDALPPDDPAFWRAESERKLAVLHSHTNIVPDEKHPVSGDGRLDMWAPFRENIGIPYAAQLAACGEEERALTVLEDVVGVVEQAADFPNMEYFRARRNGFHPDKCPDILSRMPENSDFRAYRAVTFGPRTTVHFFMASAAEHSGSEFIGIMDFTCGIRCLLTEKNPVPREGFRVPWLDPIRDHPRYKAVVERMEACREQLKSP